MDSFAIYMTYNHWKMAEKSCERIVFEVNRKSLQDKNHNQSKFTTKIEFSSGKQSTRFVNHLMTNDTKNPNEIFQKSLNIKYHHFWLIFSIVSLRLQISHQSAQIHKTNKVSETMQTDKALETYYVHFDSKLCTFWVFFYQKGDFAWNSIFVTKVNTFQVFLHGKY